MSVHIAGDLTLRKLEDRVKRAKLEMMRRNAVICAANVLRTREDSDLLRCLEQIAEDPKESELVRMTAIEVLEDLDRIELE